MDGGCILLQILFDAYSVTFKADLICIREGSTIGVHTVYKRLIIQHSHNQPATLIYTKLCTIATWVYLTCIRDQKWRMKSALVNKLWQGQLRYVLV